MTNSVFDKTINALLNRMSKLQGRLEIDVMGINCREILIHNRRLDVLKKHIDLLKQELGETRDRYLKSQRLLRITELLVNRVMKISLTLIAFLSTILGLYLAEISLNLKTISHIVPGFVSLENLPYVSFTIGILIGIFSIMFSTINWRYRSRLSILVGEYDYFKKKYTDLVNRLSVLEREYEFSYKYRLKPRSLHLCKCYEEYSSFRDNILCLIQLLTNLNNCSDINCFNNYVREIAQSLNKIGSVRKICDSIFTDEYRLIVETKCSQISENIYSECYVRITLGARDYNLDIGKFLLDKYNDLLKNKEFT
ncbi:MAG: hypothetical protein QW615_04675 [Desulfurococcaceae archaeon]